MTNVVNLSNRHERELEVLVKQRITALGKPVRELTEEERGNVVDSAIAAMSDGAREAERRKQAVQLQDLELGRRIYRGIEASASDPSTTAYDQIRNQVGGFDEGSWRYCYKTFVDFAESEGMTLQEAADSQEAIIRGDLPDDLPLAECARANFGQTNEASVFVIVQRFADGDTSPTPPDERKVS